MAKKMIDLIFELKSGCHSKEEKIQKELKLSPAEFRGILALTPESAIPCNTLSNKMGLSKSRGSRVIEKLMKSGYIKEFKKEGDRRIMYVMLTTKGVKTQDKIHKILEECESIILKNIPKSKLLNFEKSLIKISEILLSN